MTILKRSESSGEGSDATIQRIGQLVLLQAFGLHPSGEQDVPRHVLKVAVHVPRVHRVLRKNYRFTVAEGYA
ncbi:hypothetical protein ACFWIA_28960 [Streptomyces sp. NPDC127068]|uniref:hypothetical protein n=1 Tax=Streptomyces sp. NPDC127068 TaxID=3347127 RepID=UPI0036469EDB